MNKPKLLIYADAGQPTGFEKIMRGLASNLTDDFDLTVAGMGYYGQHDLEPYSFKVIPATLNPTSDFMGLNRIRKIIEEESPDIILYIQDVWNVMPLASKKPVEIPSVIYTLPDSPNIKWIYGLGLGLHSAVVTPTHFGQRELCASVQGALAEIKGAIAPIPTGLITLHDNQRTITVRLDRLNSYQNKTNTQVVPIGINPLPFKDSAPSKDAARQEFGLPADAFIILNVNTNAFRKRLDLTLVAFKRVSKLIPSAHLVLHCQGDQSSGWDLKQLVTLLDLTDKVTILTKPLTETQLFALYRTADVQINTSVGEGWGLPAIEGWQNGTPQLVPDWSATKEIWNADARIATKPHGFHYSNVNTMHGRIDVSDLVSKILAITDNLINTYPVITLRSWQSVAKEFSMILKQALNEPPTKMITLDEVFDNRLEEVKSKALDWLADL